LPVELDEIRQIEVIKGPQSALYGFNAAAGVINIITFNPLDTSIDAARVRGGTSGTREVSGIATVKPTGNSAVRVSAGGFDARDSGNNPDPVAAQEMRHVDPSRRSAHANAAVRLDDGRQLGLEASLVRGQERRLNFWYNPMPLRQEVAALKADYSGNTDFGLVSLRAYHNQFRAAADLPGGFPSSSFHNSATVLSLQDLLKVDPRNSVRLSTEYRYNTSTVYANPDSHLGYHVGSLGGMWDSAVATDLSLVNAVRFDHLQLGRSGPINADVPYVRADYDRALDAFSFNSGLVWRASDLDTAKLMVSRGFNLPTLSQFGAWETRQTAFNALEYGNPTINPTVVWNYEVSWDHALASLGASTRASVFLQRNADLIDFQPDILVTPQGQYQLGMANVGSSRAFGVELGASGRIAPHWDWSANYTFEVIRDDLRPRALVIAPGLSFHDRTPRHKVNVHLGYTQGAWELDLDAHYLTHYDLPDFNGVVLRHDNRAVAQLGDFVLLEPRIAWHVNEAVTAEVTARGLRRRHELPLSTVEPLVLFSLAARW
jgi:iron complex outermembrane receptor protein